MSVAELQNYTFVGRYARWIPEKKRRETWKESVDRVKNMMLEQFPIFQNSKTIPNHAKILQGLRGAKQQQFCGFIDMLQSREILSIFSYSSQ